MTSAHKDLAFLILDKITENLPSESFNQRAITIPFGIELADPNFHISRKIDILLEAEIFYSLLGAGSYSLGPNMPIIQSTELGWILGSPLPVLGKTSKACRLSLERWFWTIEEVSTSNLKTKEEQDCETTLVNSLKRDDSGHFVVSLPIYKDLGIICNSLPNAKKRLFAMERKFVKQPEFSRLYHDFMSEYEKLGYMSLIKEDTTRTLAASFLAIRCLQQVALDIKDTHPDFSNIIQSDFYVDNLITGANTVEEALQLKSNISDVL
nr:unnamed protein product [Callosobruchus analis]